jgi:phenylacetate-CoA ligase
MHLAEFLSPSDIKKAGIQAVSLNSEMILDSDRKAVSEAFRCPVYDEYSSVEMGPIANMCSHGNMHTFSDNVILEILDSHGQPCAPGERGEIVLTALNSFAMPFIRYRIGDYASYSENSCMCGLPFPVINSVEGRKDDSFNLKNGNAIPAWKIYEVVERPLEDYGMDKMVLKDFFLIQKKTDQAEFHYVKGPDFHETYIDELVKGAADLFGKDFNFCLNEAPCIERIKTAKRKYIHTEVK